MNLMCFTVGVLCVLHSILSESDVFYSRGFDVFYIRSSVNLIVFYSRGFDVFYIRSSVNLMCFTVGV